jgi:uncharacterized membrane protein YfcA
MFETLLLYLLFGAVAGLAAGLLGVGGGLILVPLLAFVFKGYGFNSSTIMHLALGTSLTTIVFTAASAVAAHHRRAAVIWPLVFTLAPGLLLGSLLGAALADNVSSEVLKRLFAGFEFLIGLYMIAGAPTLQADGAGGGKRAGLVFAGGVIGLVSALLGIGGGTMTVPYLTWRGRKIHQAVAVSSACGIPIALAGAVGYCLTGLDAAGLPPWSTGYIYWPAVAGIVAASLIFAPLGARLAHRLPVKRLKSLFGIVLLIMAVVMVIY